MGVWGPDLRDRRTECRVSMHSSNIARVTYVRVDAYDARVSKR